MKNARLRGIAAALILAGFAGTAAAHPGHGTDTLLQGLAHPLGLDHLLVMLAVGLWSVLALPAARAWQGPATFMVALGVGAWAGAMSGAFGPGLPWMDSAMAASVLFLGVMLALARRPLPQAVGLGLVAGVAVLHGLAHGAEAPASSGFASYAAGFLVTTAALHFGGVVAGLNLKRLYGHHLGRALNALGLVLGGTGVYLLSQI